MATQLGRYQLQRPIGRGGMAEVWLASRRGAGGVEKRVVIKRILRERVKDPRFLDLFVQEAEISMSLSHKNIVPIFDFGRVGDEFFLVMDYVDGPNLAMALSAAKPMDRLPDAVLMSHIVFEACQALAYAHDYKNQSGTAQRIAHRDVTPGNLLLSFSGEVKLGDFGLAAATAELSEGHGSARGTPAYMAPEQALGELVGPAADLYSLGLILREVLCGKRARPGEAEEQIAAAKVSQLPPLPDSVPSALALVCEKACQLEPGQRYQSAQSMAADLDAFLVQARATASSDRRPMPQQLSDWLAEIFPEGLVTKSIEGTEIKGSARTFLDHGRNDLLDEDSDATLRSMAATMVEGNDAGAGAEQDDAAVDQDEEDQDQESVGDSSSPALVAAEPSPHPATVAARSSWARGLALPLVGAALAALAYSKFAGSEAAPTSALGPTGDSGTAHTQIEDLAPIDAGAKLLDAGHAQLDAARADAAAIDAQPSIPVRVSRADAAVGPSSVLKLSSSPWSTVQVVGRKERCDETPCQISLPRGKYQLVFNNPIAGLKKTVTVTVDGDQALHQVLEAEPR